MAEMGLAGFDVSNYFGLVAPRGTPQAVVERLNEALPRLLALPEVQARFKTDALEPASLGPSTLATFLAQDFGDWQKVVASQGIRVDSV
jgi:tripartite-type tricarboxylate transporter receptor subunit TctC